MRQSQPKNNVHCDLFSGVERMTFLKFAPWLWLRYLYVFENDRNLFWVYHFLGENQDKARGTNFTAPGARHPRYASEPTTNSFIICLTWHNALTESDVTSLLPDTIWPHQHWCGQIALASKITSKHCGSLKIEQKTVKRINSFKT